MTLDDAFSAIPEPSFVLVETTPPHSSTPFTSSGFIDLDSLASLPAEDVSFLQLKGCLHIPAKPILDELIQQYFLHIHPVVPILSEVEFWAMYNEGPTLAHSVGMSLFVLQAMLSASCVVCCQSSGTCNRIPSNKASSTSQAGQLNRQGFPTTAQPGAHFTAEPR